MEDIENFENNVSRKVGIDVLTRHYGANAVFTAGTLFQPWDLKMECPTTAMTVEVKYRDGYTMESLDALGGPAVEYHKVINPENKNTVLLVVSADGVCRLRDLSKYSFIGKATHCKTTKSEVRGNDIVTDWAFYQEFDDEWVDLKIRYEYEEYKRKLEELRRQLC